ncbi:hypothetical protein ACNKHQ_05430 [Shigella flexneri]
MSAKAGWCAVMRLVKDDNVERRLHRRELAYLSADIRSMSDKALGALRLAVADDNTCAMCCACGKPETYGA